MEEKEVADMLAQYLTNRPTAEALAMAYEDIGQRLLAKIEPVDHPLDEESRLILKVINEGKGRLCFYIGINQIESGAVSISIEHLRGYLTIYELMEKTLAFLHRRYETLYFVGKFGEDWPKATVLKLLETLKNKRVAYADRIEKEEQMELNPTEPSRLDAMFNAAYLVILGEEAFKIFIVRFNQVLAILRKYKDQLEPPQSDNI